MRLSKAYSTDLKKSITPEEADTKYLLKEVRSKYNFQCPDEFCDAAVTCANLDRAKEKRKVDPYYKVVEEHSKKCLIGKSLLGIKVNKSKYSDIYSSNDEYVDNAVRLNLQPHSTLRPEVKDSLSDEDVATKGRPKLANDEEREGKRKKQRTKVLSSMVDAFLNKEQLTIQLPNLEIMPIKSVFVEIDGQEISCFTDDFRIYFGKAFINKLQNGYSIVFDKKLSYEDREVRPSFYIPNRYIEDSRHRLFQEKKLDELASKKRPKQFFIVSETGPYPKEKYINFWLEGLEYMEYRDL